jgi:hypothetical protein
LGQAFTVDLPRPRCRDQVLQNHPEFLRLRHAIIDHFLRLKQAQGLQAAIEPVVLPDLTPRHALYQRRTRLIAEP